MDTMLRLLVIALCLPVVQSAPAQPVRWEKTYDLDLPFSAHTSALFAHPSGVLLAGTTDYLGCGDYCGSEGSVYRSLDEGRTWERTGFQGAGVTSFASEGEVDLLASSYEGLYRSRDQGQTWSVVPTEGVEEYIHVVYATREGVIYLGLGGAPGSINGGIYSSSDSGQTWVVELGWGPGNDLPFAPVAFAETAGGSLLAGGDQGILHSQASGAWVATSLDSLGVIALHLGPGDTLYAAVHSVGPADDLYQSADGGERWERVALPPVRVLDVATNTRGDLLLSAADGLYGLEHGGVSWERLGDAAGSRLVTTVSDHLVTASREGGLYRSTTPVRVAYERPNGGFAEAALLEQNYPNPFNRTTVVPFNLPRAMRMRLVIYDVLGREVTVLVDGWRAAGRHHVPFDRPGLPAGLYLCRLTASGSTQETKMLLVR